MKSVTRYQSERTGKLFRTLAACTKDENKLDRVKFKKLKERIASGKSWIPKVGEYIYVDTSLYIDHGEDDVVGGLAQVTRIELMTGDPFISVAQHPDRGGRNWSLLVEEQTDLMKHFGTKFAYPDPETGEGDYI